MNNNRNTVLACIDGSLYSQSVTDYAAWVSRTVSAPLQLLHNIEHREAPPLTDLSGNIGLGSREELLEELTTIEERRSRILMEQGKTLLAQAAQRAIDSGVNAPQKLQRHGTLVETLIEMEEEIRILVIGIRGEQHQDQQRVVGNHLEAVIRALHRPVLVVNRAFAAPPREIMVAYDGSEAAEKALDMVMASPLYKGMKCHLVNVGGSETLIDKAAQALGNAGLEVVCAQLQGNVEQVLDSYQREHNIEMTVMGAFGHSRLRELMFGSTTHRMLLNSQTPLLLLR